MEIIDIDDIGPVLKSARQHQQLSQVQLADLVGVHQDRISKIENGRNLTVSLLFDIVEHLDASMVITVVSTKEKNKPAAPIESTRPNVSISNKMKKTIAGILRNSTEPGLRQHTKTKPAKKKRRELPQYDDEDESGSDSYWEADMPYDCT